MRRKVNTSTPAPPARAPAREDMAIEWREISALIPYARNARTHSDAQIAQIAGSIREFGFTNPVLIDPEGGIFGQFTSLPASMIRPPSPALFGLTSRANTLAWGTSSESSGSHKRRAPPPSPDSSHRRRLDGPAAVRS